MTTTKDYTMVLVITLVTVTLWLLIEPFLWDNLFSPHIQTEKTIIDQNNTPTPKQNNNQIVPEIDKEKKSDDDLLLPKKDIVDTEWTNLPEILVDDSSVLPTLKKEAQTFKEINETWNTNSDISLPEKINLDVPFFAQAPDWIWSLPRKEACEEASIALVAHYLNDIPLTKEKFKQDVSILVEIQKEIFWDYVDSDMEATAKMYQEYYNIWNVKIVDNPTIQDIKRELAQGHPIVAPFAGKELWNSHFTNWGPRYHVLVIKWYDEKYFYTNDVWTSHWQNFPYEQQILMNSLHDLVIDWDISTGKKRILVFSK